jgi:hypothetical protein
MQKLVFSRAAERVAQRLRDQGRLGDCWEVPAEGLLGPAFEHVIAAPELARERHALASEETHGGAAAPATRTRRGLASVWAA